MKLNALISLTSLILFSSLSAQAQMKNDTLFQRQWGMVNNGQSLYRSTGELSQDEILGTPGIDINYLDVSKQDGVVIDEKREVVVAVLDTGLDINHPELKDRIYVDREYCPTDEDLENKPCAGFNILSKNLNLTDEDGHGTHVAGIIAANTNTQGVAGVSDARVKILPVKVLNEEVNHFVYNRKLVTDWFADGISYALARGADVINMSIGWPAIIHTPKMKAVLKGAAERNIPVIVAAGNNNKEIPTYPCTEENVICVGAYDNQGKISEFSNYGGKVDISAPGESIVSLYPVESVESRVLRIKGYEVKNGTSQAAPFVAAIAASIKLVHPEITYDELKARLFSSALDEVANGEGKFTQFGRVNMKDAILNRPEVFVAANFKNLLEVNYSVKTGKFTFPIELKSYVSDETDVEVEVSTGNSEIEIDSPKVSIDLYKGTPKKFLVEGTLKNLLIDSNQMIQVRIKTKNKEFTNRTKIVFSRDLNFESNSDLAPITEKVENTAYTDLLYFRGSNKTSRLTRVKTNYGASPEYFTMKSRLQSDEKSVLSFVQRTSEGTWSVEDLSVRKFHTIIKVYKNDLDHDGNEDYLIYGILPGEESLGYTYILENERLDLDFNILEFEGFPLTPDELSEVQLINTSYKGKTLKVPSFYATYRLPEQDNVDDLLDRINEEARAPHLYYLDPQTSGEFDLRVLNSPTDMENLKEELGIVPWNDLILEKPFNITTSRQENGAIIGLLSSGAEFEKDYFQYRFKHTDTKAEVIKLNIPFAYASQNSSLLVWSMSELGKVSDDVNLVVQPSREMARSLIFRDVKSDPTHREFSTDNYRDPVFGIIGSFDDESQSHLLEGRYFVHYRNNLGQKGKLRINRESSFPGVQFSETLSPVVVKKGEQTYSGAFINSTLIFGSRLYTMVANDNGELTRPAQLSVEIPDQCVHLSPEAIEGSYQYLLLCRERDNSVSFKRMPLVLGE